MITIAITIETTQEELKRCISAAWQKKYGEELSPNTIKEFAVGENVTDNDIKNILLGSSLGEIAKEENVIMKRTR